jgi:hypothetical protein
MGPRPRANHLCDPDVLTVRSAQDHRHGSAVHGCQPFRTAATTIAGIELSRRIQNGQFNLGWSRLKDRRVPAVRNVVLAAS